MDYSPINKIEVDWHKSKAGYLFDFNSLYWKLDGSFTLDLKRLNQNITESTKFGFKKTICRYAEEQSAYTVLSVLAQFNNYFKYTNESTINIKGLTKYRTMLDTEFEHKLGTLRVFLLDWYNWDFDGVTQDSIKYLKELKLKGFTKGKAVKRACPYSGPLTHNELSSVISWASDAYQNQILSLKEFAYLIAIILTGRRSIQIRTLRGIDLLVTTDNNSTNYILNCPRSKQKKANFREHFNSLSINEDLYLLLKEQWNASIRKIEQQLKSKLIISLKKQIPIFLEDGKIQQINTIDNLKEFLFNTPGFLHMTFQSAMRLMKNISHKNKARSERTGEYINLTSRRFRYTKGTNLSRKGISGVALASALDHSDTQNIGVYTENTEETAKQIDAIMAPILAPLAQAFSGQLISSEREAIRAIDPLTTVVLLLGLSGEMTNEERNHQSNMACIYVFIIMIASFYCGQLIMSTFGISIPGLRIAGGMIVGFIGFRMLFPQQPSHKTLEADAKKKEPSNNIAFVPLAMPSTAGPGTIAMIISMASTVQSGGYDVSTWVAYTASILVPLILCIILWFCMRSAGSIMRFMGKSGIEATSRIMGLLLVCVGTQFIINGVKEIILSFPNI